MADLERSSGRLIGLGLAALVLVSGGGGAMAADRAAAGEPSVVPLAACGSYDRLRELLARQFGEQPAATGVAEDGTVMQVFASARAATWTVVSVDAHGIACVVAAGRARQQEALGRIGDPA